MLISEHEFAEAMGTNHIPLPGLNTFLMSLMKLDRVNQHMIQAGHLSGIEFIDKILGLLGVVIEVDEEELRHIPKQGAFMVVANHPYGGVESLILIKQISKVRPDIKLMANYLLKRIHGLNDYLIPVNPFDDAQVSSNIGGTRQAMDFLRRGIPVAVFPAGEVSSFQPHLQKVIDKKWHPVVGKMILKAQVPVVPLYFHGNNGLLFNLLGIIHPMLRTARLPAELFNKRGHKVHLRFGKPVLPKEMVGNLKQAGPLLNYLRARTYALGTGIPTQRSRLLGKFRFQMKKKVEPIVDAIPALLLREELKKLEGYKICVVSHYSVYITPASAIPYTIQEIGRLREETFRKVGEGTLKSTDLDMFDIYYRHLFIWDHQRELIVGAYRIGHGDELFYGMGKKGFYLSQLFKINKAFFPIMKSSLELGRSWIREEYQQKTLPLFLLWKGISHYLSNYPQYRYLIGPVSISSNFSAFSRSLLVAYIKKYYYQDTLAAAVKPKKKFKPNYLKVDSGALLEQQRSFEELEKLIKETELSKCRFPVLLRQYLALGAKMIAFNVDPAFCHSLDGFLVLDLWEVPPEQIEKWRLAYGQSSVVKDMTN